MGRHDDLDGDHVLGPAERPGGMLTLGDLDDELQSLVADHERVEQHPGYEFPADPDDPGNALVLTDWAAQPRPSLDHAAHPLMHLMGMPIARHLELRTAVGDVLGQHGVGSGGLFASLAAAAGLELAAACASLMMETGPSGDIGERNRWGHDGVDTDGCYAKGAAVTPENYACVRRSPRAGYNGVGPVQITWKGYWAAADARGGAWRPEISTAVGFETLAQGIRTNGVRTGFRAYNGTGAAAEHYADVALGWLAQFRGWLVGAAPAPAPAPGGRPTLRPGDTGPLVGAVIDWFNAGFPAYDGTPIPKLNPPLFGPRTTLCVQEFQRRSNIPAGGPCEIGPHTWAEMDRLGFRG